MGLIKKAIAIGGVYYVYKKVNENKTNQQCNGGQQSPPAAPSQQQSATMTTLKAVGHQSYCNGTCGGQCSFDASERHGFEAKAPAYDEKVIYEEKAVA